MGGGGGRGGGGIWLGGLGVEGVVTGDRFVGSEWRGNGVLYS